MRLLTALLLIVPAPHDRWFGPDKVKHFIMSSFAQAMAYNALRLAHAGRGPAAGAAAAATIGIGVGKEVYDRRRGEFSVRDLAWDGLGVAAGTVLVTRGRR